MPEENRYRRLRAGTGSSLVSRHSLWIGTDHVLAITNTFGTESYRRYYFSEIQAFVSHRTVSWLIGNIIIGFITLCCVVPAVVMLGSGDSGPSIAFFIVGGIMALILLIHLIAGPTAKLFVQTAASYDPIPGVTRWFMIRRIIRRLEPLVHEAQRGPPAAASSISPGAPVVPPAPNADSATPS